MRESLFRPTEGIHTDVISLGRPRWSRQDLVRERDWSREDGLYMDRPRCARPHVPSQRWFNRSPGPTRCKVVTITSFCVPVLVWFSFFLFLISHMHTSEFMMTDLGPTSVCTRFRAQQELYPLMLTVFHPPINVSRRSPRAAENNLNPE